MTITHHFKLPGLKHDYTAVRHATDAQQLRDATAYCPDFEMTLTLTRLKGSKMAIQINVGTYNNTTGQIMPWWAGHAPLTADKHDLFCVTNWRKPSAAQSLSFGSTGEQSFAGNLPTNGNTQGSRFTFNTINGELCLDVSTKRDDEPHWISLTNFEIVGILNEMNFGGDSMEHG